jgi:hypothetical protein
MPPKNFIKDAIRRPGALHKLAVSENALTKSGTIKLDWLKAKAKEKGRVGQQARLALTLRKLD